MAPRNRPASSRIAKADWSVAFRTAANLFTGNSMDLSTLATALPAEAGELLSFAIEQDDTGASLSGFTLHAGDNTGTALLSYAIAEDANHNAFAAPNDEWITVAVQDRPVYPLEGGVTQENARYKAGGAELADPACTEPEGSIGDPFIYYNGILRNGNRYSQSFDKPTEAGIYTVYVSYMTDDAYYEGGAEFEILPGWARVARPTAVRRKIVFPEGGSVSQICGADPPFIQIAAACASGYASRAYPGRRIDFP